MLYQTALGKSTRLIAMAVAGWLLAGCTSCDFGGPEFAKGGSVDVIDVGSDAEASSPADIEAEEIESDVCEPQCAHRECGPNGCGGTCTPGCSAGKTYCFQGECVPQGCDDGTDCVGLCTNLGVCEECGCRYDSACGAQDKPGCCEVDADCDDGEACSVDDHTCYTVCEFDQDCLHRCGEITNCQRCACGDEGRCVTLTRLPPECCTSDADCDDGLDCTADDCDAESCRNEVVEGVEGSCIFDGTCFSGCFDNFDGCPCDGQTYGGCTGSGQSCADLAVLYDPHYCVAHCGGLCCLTDTDCGADHVCRALPGEYLVGATAVTEALLGTCVAIATPPACGSTATAPKARPARAS